MKLTLQATVVVALIFTLVCLSVAIKGFASLPDMTDPQEIADAKGFAWFWAFLASVAAGFALLAWRMRNGVSDDA